MAIPLDIVGYQKPRYIYILGNPHRIFIQSPPGQNLGRVPTLKSFFHPPGGSTFMVG